MAIKKSEQHVSSYREIFGTFFAHSHGFRRWIPLLAALLFLDGFILSRLPPLLKHIVDGLQQDAEAFVRDKLFLVAALALGLAAVWYVGGFFQDYLNTKLSTTLIIKLKLSLYTHLQKLGLDFYYRNKVGEITTRLTSDVSTSAKQIFSTTLYLLGVLGFLMPAGITMARLSLPLFAFFFGATLVFAIIINRIVPLLRARQRAVRDQDGQINARLTEDISSVSLIKAYAREPSFVHEVGQEFEVFLARTLRTEKLRILIGRLITVFIIYFVPFSMLCFGAYLVRTSITVGTLIAFYAYWQTAANPVRHIVSIFPTLFSAFASFDRVLEFFRETPLVADRPHAKKLSVENGAVEFRDVRFQYPLVDGEIVLDGLTFTAEAHKSLAIVGESGAGKSTIINLMLRFYDPLEGSVLVDGKDISQFKQQCVRRRIGLVMQDTILLSGTIRHNMQFAKPRATDKEIIEALKQAEAWNFVKDTPNGLDTILGERGVRLSGGQKQRISIARVFLKNPPIVVFDEATSSLDTITEKQIQETMTRLFHDRTSVIIAHRLSTIVNCDQILVLDKGKVLAMGTHAELLAICPRYQEMCLKQGMERVAEVV